MSMFRKVPMGVQPPAQTSAPQNTSVGSGSRPTRSKMALESSAPEDPRTLGRAPEGWLK